MPRVALTEEQRRENKLLEFKLWVKEQQARNDMTQEQLGNALGVSQGKVSTMLAVPSKKSKGKKVKLDTFTLGQAFILFDLFEADESTRRKFLML